MNYGYIEILNLTTNLNYVEISINPFYNKIPNFIEEDVSSYNNYPKIKIYLNKITEFNLNLFIISFK